mmetsp:Transcript_36300/g.64401  ORF Transcript_36300/g.64401 Transcript_36300/m.64401 type:complete len:301 (+) Transcript_36300:22-924(+)
MDGAMHGENWKDMQGVVDEREDRTWDWGDKAVYWAHVFWMLKEVGWVLLVPALTLPSGVIATVLMFLGMGRHCGRRSFADLTIELVMAVWLGTNVLWMTSEVLYDEPDVKLLWSLTPLLPEDKPVYETMEHLSAVGFFVAVSIYFCGLAVVVFRYVQPKYGLSRRALQGYVLHSYLASWCFKDFFWAEEMFWPAIFTDLVTVPLLLINARVDSESWASIHRSSWAWSVWTFANAVWITGELMFPTMAEFNYVAAAMLFTAFVMVLTGYRSYKDAERKRAAWTEESSATESSAEFTDDSKA